MAIPTISQSILRGDISTYLAANDNANGALFGTKIAAPISPVTILMVTDALRWSLVSQTTKSQRATANYLIWLCGKYEQQAEFISQGAGGGTVIPSSTVGLPNPYDWEIGEATSSSQPLANGDVSAVLTSFIGYNIEFTRNNLTQNTTNLGDGTSYYNWNRSTGLFTVSPAASIGELFRILPTGGGSSVSNIGETTVFTSGLLTIGKTYKILVYQSGDNFSNIATVVEGIINTDGCIFTTSTGTTPTDWSNSSVLLLLN